MSLYSYKKVDSTEQNYYDFSKEFLVLDVHQKDKVNIWNATSSGYNTLQDIVNASKATNILIPMFFIILGSFFILKHVYPQIKYQIEKQNGLVSQGNISPISEGYIDLSKYISNPAGLAQVTEEAFNEHILIEDTVSKNYQGVFFITIPSLGIDRLPVQSNVDSTSEAAYNAVLDTRLAHFKGTGLPISDIANNIVIYGHSASPNYGPKPSDPMVAFSFLPNLKVGDDIILEIEGQTYKFKMQKSKIVEPEDTSIINGTRGKRTLTLFTCYPAGDNTQRYVAVAREV